MKKLLWLAGLVLLSIVAFLGVFSVVRRPLVVDDIQKSLDYKLAYARTLSSPKLIIFAGSNGRYSHRCAAFSTVLERPCVNASLAFGLGIDFQLDQWWPLLHAGDVVYMPLEYGQYRHSSSDMHGGMQNAMMVQHQREYLWSLSPQRIAAAYGSFDLSSLINGLIEMALERRGFERRSSAASLTPQGDESGHTAQKGEAYAKFVRSMAIDNRHIPEHSDALVVIEAFLAKARRAGVTVVGGLPTLPDSATVEDADIERLRRLYERHGQRFVVLPNRSQYPLACFFDSTYHLNEGCQQAHSEQVARVLSNAVAQHALPPESAPR
ncbi:MAG: hypothetical protein B7Y51_04910 [Burkholderiales bacterium 28-67-8]|nr:MAG: hypothetical protein B7Y51_04910 [Burkholderiales bacterium 28-67-8]